MCQEGVCCCDELMLPNACMLGVLRCCAADVLMLKRAHGRLSSKGSHVTTTTVSV